MTYKYKIIALKNLIKFIVIPFQSCSFLKHKKMKNLFTICTLFFAVFLLPDSRIQAKERSFENMYNVHSKCYVTHPDREIGDLFRWESSLISSAVMMPCPAPITINLGPGECGHIVNYDFAGLPPIQVQTIFIPQLNPGAVSSTVFCEFGQTRYSKTLTNHASTDLIVTSIDLGVYESFNNPLVTINIYSAAGLLLSSTTKPISTQFSPPISGIFPFLVTATKIEALSDFKVEIVADAPWVSIFKMGFNSNPDTSPYLSKQSLSCNSNYTAVGSPNSMVFTVKGTPEAYKIVNTTNNYESGDFFPVNDDTYFLNYSITNATGLPLNSLPIINGKNICTVSININEYSSPTGALTCNDLVQVSLDDNCEVIVTPDMLLEGNEYGCYDNYIVQIIGINGVNLKNKVTRANIGQTLKTQVIGPNGNSCWGEILVQDKFGPDLVCGNVYATCSTDLRPGSYLPNKFPVSAVILDGEISDGAPGIYTFPITVNEVAGTSINDLNVYLDISHSKVSDLAATLTSPDGTTITLFNVPGSVSCQGDDMMVIMDDESTQDISIIGSCEATSPSIAGKFKSRDLLSAFDGKPMNGNWKVTIYDLNTGEGGNVNHIDLVFGQSGGFIPFPTPNDVTFSHVSDNTYIVKGIDACSDATLTYTDEIVEEDCSSIYSKVIKRCWSGYDTRGNLANPCCQYIYVYRNSLSTIEFPLNYDGLPGNHQALSCHIFGDSIPPVEHTGMPGSNFCDNVQIAPPVDVIIDLCERSYKIIRTHKVIEWCTGRVIIHNQIIKVLDDEGPELDCPDNITISTDDYACSATYKVPRPIVSNECSEELTYHLSYSNIGYDDPDYISTNVNQITSTITGLPIGPNWIKWTVTDNCGNSSFCIFRVTVEDRVRPVPVCDQFTVASITGSGKAIVDAFTFDDGSTDNCGILKFEARKMTDLCNFGTSLFTPSVEFCCAEFNTSVMVEMRVTDVHGNSNTCMVEVRVQDKLHPHITKCAPDITLPCQADYTDLKVTKIPEFVDNCSAAFVICGDNLPYCDDVKINQCGVGTVTRTWKVIDKQGLTASCVQVITLIDDDPFWVNEENHLDPSDDIVWPLNYSTVKCLSSLDPMSLPDGYDKPDIDDDNCSLVAAHYKDQVFKFVDGSCEKILRTWTVIDWCQYNENFPVRGEGWYEHVQIIKLSYNIPPKFEDISLQSQKTCIDRTVASYGNCEGLVDFTMEASGDCPEGNINLKFKYEIYTENGNTLIFSDTLKRFKRTLKIGKYRVKWTVADRCGNISFCTHYVDVIESKLPTPYCISSLTTAVMNANNGTVSIWAKDYDRGSFDNCTPDSLLIFTFFGETPVDSLIKKEHYFNGDGLKANKNDYENGVAQIWIPSKRTSGIIFDCFDIPNGISQDIPLDIWVTDLAGNQDFCTITLILQDNNGICPDIPDDLIAINGKVSRDQNVIKGVDVTIESIVPEVNKTIKSDANGNYSFASLPKANNFTISMTDNRNILNGVSTLDLVMIQRHILGIEVLNDPKKIIAADVDNNSKVTASDLVALRKNILGISNEFPNGQKSWRFITNNQVFTDPSKPFPFTEKYVYTQLNDNKVNQNFFGIKIGDVNNSAVVNIHEANIESRSKNILALETDLLDVKAGEVISVPVFTNTFEDVYGYQFTMQFDPSLYSFVDVTPNALKVNDANFGFHRTNEGIITTSWNSDDAITLPKGDVLFTLKFKVNKNATNSGVISVSSMVTPAIAYDAAYHTMDITLGNRNSTGIAGFELLQNIPNPFNDNTQITFRLPEEGKTSITVTDITGKILKVISGQYSKGEHTIQLNKSELGAAGVLLYKIESGKYTDTKKMIIIE
jgi:subtilisin-like proprotein convertase family protein